MMILIIVIGGMVFHAYSYKVMIILIIADLILSD